MFRSGYRNDSVVYLDFLFERQTGFFLLQIYTPLTLIVFCSWVSFWLVKTEAVKILASKNCLSTKLEYSGRRGSCEDSSGSHYSLVNCQPGFWRQIQA